MPAASDGPATAAGTPAGRFLARWWFLLGYGVVVALAAVWPASIGQLALDALRPWLIAGIFLCAGLVLPTTELLRATAAWRLHGVIALCCFGIAPVLALGLAWAGAAAGLPAPVCAGLIVLGCLPTTIGSCVAITGLCGGASAIALVSSVAGNLVGVVLAPLLIAWLEGHAAAGDALAAMRGLLLVAVLPLAIGQTIRWRASAWCEARRPLIGVASGLCLLAVILGIACAVVARGAAGGVGLVLAAGVVLQAALLGCGWLLARLAGGGPAERIAVAVTASHKTAALGVPLIVGMYGTGHPDLPLLVMPVVLYHLLQMGGGALLSARLGRA